MKRTFLPFCILLISSMAYGQAQEGSVAFEKSQQPAAVIELAYSPDIIKAAMNDYLSRKGKSKTDDLKGFSTYRNTELVPGDSTNADLYFKIERKSRREKEVSVVSLLLTSPKEGAVPNVRYLNMEQARDYLNGLVPAIDAYNLELQIKEQNAMVIKAESKYKSLQHDGEDLVKKRENLEKKIEDNKRDQQKQMTEIENQKQKLAVLSSGRKS